MQYMRHGSGEVLLLFSRMQIQFRPSKGNLRDLQNVFVSMFLFRIKYCCCRCENVNQIYFN